MKRDELSNHRGNVMTVISDKIAPIDTTSDGLWDYFNPSLVSATDYYPFGMGMPGRAWHPEEYRYSYGRHERLDEALGSGNIIDMGDRWLDLRIGRTPKMDAKAKEYPDISPYAYAANNPIFFTDSDGKEVIAYSSTSQELVLKTLNYAFGDEHGFSFENNKLIHNGAGSKKMTPQQNLMFKYFNETLLRSTTVTTITTNLNVSARIDAGGKLQIGGMVLDGEATTFHYPAVVEFTDSEPGKLPIRLKSLSAYNEIVVTPGIINNGINLETEKGYTVFDADHATLHEFGHAIVNTIISEFGGQFNGIDFREMDQQQRSDWAIRFTNTLLQSQKMPLETGAGQHDRKAGDKPLINSVSPLSK